jgi:hypothetical protein
MVSNTNTSAGNVAVSRATTVRIFVTIHHAPRALGQTTSFETAIRRFRLRRMKVDELGDKE